MRHGQTWNPIDYINNSNIKTKFIVLGLVVAVPMILFMLMNMNRLRHDIAFSQTEQEGVAFIAPVRKLIQNSQAHRGMSNAFLSGKRSLKPKIDAAEQRANEAMIAIEKLDQRYGAKFKTHEQWAAIKRDWSSIKQQWAKAKSSPASVQATDSFKKHTVFINRLLDYILYLSDQSGLTIDPEVSTYYLIDIVYFRTLNIIENMGKIRGLGAGVAARKTITPTEQTKLSVMSADVENLLKSFQHDMAVLHSAGHDANIKPSMDRLHSSIEKLNQMVRAELLDTEQITIDSALYFAEASKSIKLSYETFDQLTALLADLLSVREQAQNALLTKIYGLAIGSLLIVGLLLVSIARNVTQKSSELKTRMAALVQGQFGNVGLNQKHAKDELGEAMRSADSLENTLNSMLAAMNYVTKQHAKGDTDSTINASEFKGRYAEMAAGVNETVKGHIDMNQKVLACVKKFGEGDLNATLEQFPGKKALANRAVEQVRSNINALIEDSVKLVEAARQGQLSTRADATRHLGDFRKVVEGFNDTLDALTQPLHTAARYVDSIANGKIPEKIEDDYHGDFDALKRNLNQCIDAINALITDANGLATAAADGKLSTRADPNRHRGDFRKIVLGVNNTLDSVVGPLNVAAECVANIAKGEIPQQITEPYAGDFNIIKSNLNTCIDAVNRLVSDANMLAEAAADGRVTTRADISKHEGDFRKVVEGVNATLETIVQPIQTVKEATTALNGVANEISTGNNDLSARTERQASSLEKTASNMDQLAATVKQNAESAKHANHLADVASNVTKRGSDVVDNVVVTMADINESAGKIEEIISVIDGIAFQTNILALNAAVEAARAGEQGRGFAVVADEVRHLAQRSASAAKEIKLLITDSVAKANDGTAQVETAGKTMQEILNSVSQVSAIISEISSASEKQSQDIGQVNVAIANMDETTQQNAALVEEAAAAAESLLDQTNALFETVSVFKLDDAVQNAADKLVTIKQTRDDVGLAERLKEKIA